MINVLILEDNGAKLAEIVALLVGSGATNHDHIETASDALRTRKLLGENLYDLLILDLAVPERLGEAVSTAAGNHLLEDLFELDHLHMPKRVVGLTGFEELAGTFAESFTAHGIILVRYEPSSVAWHSPLLMQIRQIEAQQRATETAERSYDTFMGVVCALEVEFDALLALPWKFEEISVRGDPTIYSLGQVPSDSGAARSVVAALCPRMGMSAASVTATKLIGAFRPGIVAMSGITAALRGQANLGDVIVADEVWDWGMGKWERRNDTLTFLPGPHHLSLDSGLRAAAVRVSRARGELDAIKAGWKGPKPDTTLTVKIAPVASGAAVIAAQEMSEHIKAHHRRLVGIEMEAYGLYAAATEAVFPRPRAIAIKAATDFADEHKGDEFRHYCAYASASVLQLLVERYL